MMGWEVSLKFIWLTEEFWEKSLINYSTHRVYLEFIPTKHPPIL